ncbi:1-phosphofructokinase [Actinomycetospora sp. CA-084318]|uniref:1-phosphofructokinase n=1 Tax=Actinomycetospora sp. CA-084318 TaxID=3239892 RepID=UPI003D96D2D6
MIVTVTPNPSIDRTVEIPVLTPGAVLRATGHRVDPGGKGVNVSRVLARFGRPTLAVMPGGEGDLAALLRRAGVQPVCTPANGATRVNTALVEPNGTTTKVNEPGVALTADQVDALVDTVRAHAAPAAWVVTAGSVPSGATDDLHGRITRAARSAGARVAVDTSGVALAHAVAQTPDLIKPNVAELAELVGHPLPALADVLAAARELVTGGIGTVLVSMGASGAIAVDTDDTWHVASPTVPVRSTVGAGDSTLAGYLIALESGAKSPDALHHAVACGAAAVGLPGTAVPGPADLDLTHVRPATAPDSTLDLTGEAA